eukprot:COSAG02_NODE_8920_length_2400_cov_1.365928_4_plen_65_part_00
MPGIDHYHSMPGIDHYHSMPGVKRGSDAGHKGPYAWCQDLEAALAAGKAKVAALKTQLAGVQGR